MAGFFIEKLVVTGNGKKTSSVEFGEGLNFIVGPSNTGKSYIVECIDYLFGFEPKKNKPFRFDPNLGYDNFKLFTRTPNGTVIFQRKLGENRITLSGTDPNFEYRVYSLGNSAKYNINSVWLQMIGINESHKILASPTGKVHKLTWRYMLPMFFIKQENITRTSSILLNPSLVPNMAETPSKTTTLFLMTGKDSENNEIVEDKRIRTAKRDAVINYIKGTVGKFAQRESELIEARHKFNILFPNNKTFSTFDIGSEIDTINCEIDELHLRINSIIQQSKKLMSEIYEYNSRLAECETIADRFAALHGQYKSDIERLSFIIEGNLAYSLHPLQKLCPFCESEIKLTDETSSHMDAALSELNHIRIHLTELEKAERDITDERLFIESVVKELENRKFSIDKDVSLELKPSLTELKKKLSTYCTILEINKELEIIQREERTFSMDLAYKKIETNPTEHRYDINNFFDSNLLQTFEKKLKSILRSCHYESASSARLDMNTFDLEVGGKAKATSNGGGYCGFLNTILSLALIEYLAEHGEYSPGLLVADSPLTQLSESEFKTKTDTMKSGLLEHLLSINNNDIGKSNVSTSDMQIIMIEHKEKLPMLDSVMSNASNVKVIEFTHDKNHGRYGFLDGVFDYK